MSDLLDLPCLPQAFFIKLAPVDRATIENWVRSGALQPAAPKDESSEAILPFVGGTLYSLRNMMKVEIMHRLRASWSIPPKVGARVADTVIGDHEQEIANEFGTAKPDGSAANESKLFPVYGMPSKDPEGALPRLDWRDLDSVLIVVPLGAIAHICFAKLLAYLNWAEVELPRLKDQVSELARLKEAIK